MSKESEYILKVLRNDLANSEDNVIRAKMQQKRFPFDYDNNDAIVRYEKQAESARRAIASVRP